MTRKHIILLAVLLGVAVVSRFAYLEIRDGPRSMLAGFDRSRHRRYEDIAIGSSKADAIAALGEPRSKGKTFSLPQRRAFEHYFEAAERSTAVEYLLWINGTNWYYCIGFDASGKAVVKGEGCS